MPKKEKIQRMFDSIAPSYDRLNHLMSLNVDKLWRRHALKEIVDGTPQQVLDVACGTGDSTISVAKAAAAGSLVTGADISEGMMALVMEKARKAGVEDRIRLQVADGENLPYADGAFHRVTCAFGIRNFEHKEQGLREFLRVLAPGGKAVILELSVPRNRVLRALYDLYFMHILPWVGGIISGDKAAYQYLPASVHAFPAPDRFCSMMEEAGFRNVRHKALSMGLCRMYTGEKDNNPLNPKSMSNYFYDMLPREEFERIPYLPTVGEFVEWMEKEYADMPALSDQTNTITYKELCDRVARRRAFIEGLGLEKGAHIAIFDRNSQDAIELFLAVTSAGYVAMNFPASLPEMAVIGSCMKFDIAAIFVRDEFAPLCQKLQGVKVLPASSIADTKAPVTVVDKEQPAALFFTGGTTGTPKGAVLSHRALMRGSYNAIFKPGKVIGVHRYIALLPLSHVFGLIAGTMGCFYTGNLIYTCEDMKATIGKLPVIKPTLLVIVPGICDILSGLVKMYGPQFLGGSLRMIISGAANVPPRLVSIFSKLGVEFCFGYGLTETANLTSANANAVEKPTSIGKIYPGQEARIVDGELWVKGDNLFSGYYKDPEKTAEALTPDGWLRTGDLCRFDEEGFLYITGRIKNLIVLSNGENVSPEALEEPFYADPCVRDAMVKEDELNGSQVIAVEILPLMPAFDSKPWEEVEAYMNNLVAKINANLPSTHQIRKVTVRTEDFKRTGSMKVSRV
ncbi:MAG: bifunctional demethylmenaquinone methyltransferase/2-methoxy-6-polyprenyl-1,4-benzoquinol methylase UbiE [Bacteroidales bacterium]|nr:bifunctional demethylmenaquinone methyltransferase/2-methoxy-6-polyprenyl-1,4-benzoquinol methylase UbiE [Bacteroidales bacterium]